ncbi:hypothetical protein D1N53_24360, partial [Clostridioides difficile]
RLEKELKEVCLLEQTFVKNPDITVKQLVADVAKAVGSDIKVVIKFIKIHQTYMNITW